MNKIPKIPLNRTEVQMINNILKSNEFNFKKYGFKPNCLK